MASKKAPERKSSKRLARKTNGAKLGARLAAGASASVERIDDPTADDLERLRRLADYLEFAAAHWSSGYAEKIKAAHDACFSLETKKDRLRGCLDRVAFAMHITDERRQKAGAKLVPRGQAAQWLRLDLALYDPAFATLTVAHVETILSQADVRSIGGDRTKGVRGVAASLAVACGAFAFDDIEKARDAFKAADPVKRG